MTKIHYQLQTKAGLSKAFRKSVYKVHAESTRVVVHYIGNAAIAENFPHGNAKRPINFLPSAKSLTTCLEDRSVKMVDLKADKVGEPEQFQPRNKRQKLYFEQKSQLSADSFLVLHEIAYMFPGFIWSITTYPDLTVTFGLTEFFVLLQDCSPASVVLTYDTTFNLGDFYLTTLVLQLGQFVDKPIMPIAFMLHERKFQILHEDFCRAIEHKLPTGVSAAKLNVCTDGESGCHNAIEVTFPAWNVFNCWNHIIRDVEFWAKKRGASAEEIVVYKQQVRNLLTAESSDDYDMTLASHKATWSQAFTDYFTACLEKRVRSSTTYHLRQCGFSADSITTNNSESMNAVIKRFQDHREVQVDKLVFAMYRLQLSYGLNINKSVNGFGPYVPVDAHQLSTMQLPQCPEYDDILKELGKSTFAENVPDTVLDVACALQVVHIPQHQCFSVSNASGTVNSVRLFPKETCTCPVSSSCCHIIAVKKAVGMSTQKMRHINLGQLRRNSRKRSDKKSGRKQPRKGDLTFTEAPDSILADTCTYSAAETSPTNAVAATSCSQTTMSCTPEGGKERGKKRVRFKTCDETCTTPIPDAVCATGAGLKVKSSSSPSATTAPGIGTVASPERFVLDECLTSTPVTTEPRKRLKLTPNSAALNKYSTKHMSSNTVEVIEDSPKECITGKTGGSPVVMEAENGDAANQSTALREMDLQLNADCCLTDTVINAAQNLMRQHTDDSGLRDTVLVAAHAVKLDANLKFVQIVHDAGAHHWLVVTNRGCNCNTIRIFCSLGNKPTDECMQSIVVYVSSQLPKLTVEVMNVA